MSFGKTLLGQLSHVTNTKGVEYLRNALPVGYTLELIEVNDPKRMHIDTTLLPIREGLLLYHLAKLSQFSLRKHTVLENWDLRPFPFTPRGYAEPPSSMASLCLAINVLVLSGRQVVIEEQEVELAQWMRGVGMIAILCSFRRVNNIGGSIYYVMVDLVREE